MKFKAKAPIQSGGGEIELDVSSSDGRAISKFFGAAVPGFIKDKIGIWNDNARLERLENLYKIVRKAKKISEEYNINTSTLPLKLGVRFMEDASLEDDDTLQDMWANLLANSDSSKTSASSIYMAILKNMTPAEAKLLNIFYPAIAKGPELYRNDLSSTYSIPRSIILETLKEYSDADVILDYLIKQDLIKYASKESGNRLAWPYKKFTNDIVPSFRMPFEKEIDNEPTESEKVIDYLQSTTKETDKNYVQLTTLGQALIRACNQPAVKLPVDK